MLLRLQCYSLKVCYRKGKDMTVADALSIEYLTEEDPEMETLEHINMLDKLDVTPDRYLDIAQSTSVELSDLCNMIVYGWPDSKSEAPVSVREYWDSRDMLSVTDGIVYKGMGIGITSKSTKPHATTNTRVTLRNLQTESKRSYVLAIKKKSGTVINVPRTQTSSQEPL